MLEILTCLWITKRAELAHLFVQMDFSSPLYTLFWAPEIKRISVIFFLSFLSRGIHVNRAVLHIQMFWLNLCGSVPFIRQIRCLISWIIVALLQGSDVYFLDSGTLSIQAIFRKCCLFLTILWLADEYMCVFMSPVAHLKHFRWCSRQDIRGKHIVI